jgi:mitochondrial chaperone BCS1
MLFQSLRSGVIVLLEDVDSAGLGREAPDEFIGPGWDNPLIRPAKITDPDDMDASELRKVLREKMRPPKSSVTLSGLLNSIDGAGAPEGHILIMTSNKPESLDDALVRAGRVDVRVKFDYASKSQTRDIFANMYRPQKQVDANGELTVEYKKRLADIKGLATEFAKKVPSRKLSPAQFQDYILTKKTKPEKAVEEVQQWMVEQIKLAEKEKMANGVDGVNGVNGVSDANGVSEQDEEFENESDGNSWASGVDGADDNDDDDDITDDIGDSRMLGGGRTRPLSNRWDTSLHDSW